MGVDCRSRFLLQFWSPPIFSAFLIIQCFLFAPGCIIVSPYAMHPLQTTFLYPDHWSSLILGHERIDLYLDNDIPFCALLHVPISYSFLLPSHSSFPPHGELLLFNFFSRSILLSRCFLSVHSFHRHLNSPFPYPTYFLPLVQSCYQYTLTTCSAEHNLAHSSTSISYTVFTRYCSQLSMQTRYLWDSFTALRWATA